MFQTVKSIVFWTIFLGMVFCVGRYSTQSSAFNKFVTDSQHKVESSFKNVVFGVKKKFNAVANKEEGEENKTANEQVKQSQFGQRRSK